MFPTTTCYQGTSWELPQVIRNVKTEDLLGEASLLSIHRVLDDNPREHFYCPWAKHALIYFDSLWSLSHNLKLCEHRCHSTLTQLLKRHKYACFTWADSQVFLLNSCVGTYKGTTFKTKHPSRVLHERSNHLSGREQRREKWAGGGRSWPHTHTHTHTKKTSTQ